MGVSGPGLFDDDTAWDVRSLYLHLVGEDLSGPQATQQLLHEWSDLLDDPHVRPAFWLALASTQWKSGRLEPQVLKQALEVIDSGADLARWDAGSQIKKKRQVVLEKLRAQLVTTPPAKRQIRKRFQDSNEWQTGDLVAYRLLSGRFIVLRVIGHNTSLSGTAPVCELLKWVGQRIPDKSRLQSLPIWKKERGLLVSQFMIGRTRAKERPDDRLQHLGIKLEPAQKLLPYVGSRWSWLDEHLKEWFGLE